MTQAATTADPGASAEPGFAAPAVDSALAFRALLDAMARPGVALRAPPVSAAAEPLSQAATVALLTLADPDAPVWFAADMRSPQTERLARFFLGAAPTEQPERAAFACGRFPALEKQPFPTGNSEFPDRSTTLIVETDGFDPGAADAARLRLSGPGIDGAAQLSVAGLGPQFTPWIRENRALFPLGLDLLLVHGDQLVGLPRSTMVEAV